MALKWFHRVPRLKTIKEKCCQIYSRMKILEQNFHSKFRRRELQLKSYKRYFTQLYILNKFQWRTILRSQFFDNLGSRRQDCKLRSILIRTHQQLFKSSESIYLPLCHPGPNNDRRFCRKYINFTILLWFSTQFWILRTFVMLKNYK
jgi:hypothetical protein